MKPDYKNIDFHEKRDSGFIGKLLFYLYRIQKRPVRNFVTKLLWHFLGKHHQFYSETLRRIFKHYHGVDVGLYSHGFCFDPGKMPPGTTIGRYCSIAYGVTVHDANHPVNLKSSHAFFFNPSLGYTNSNILTFTRLKIENDVWIGQNAIILPSCSRIGTGAVIAAGAVVNKDIPAYGIAVGNPCRIIRYRFSNEKIEELLKSKWWEKSIDEIMDEFEAYQTPLEKEEIR